MSEPEYRGHLPRLAPEYYCGLAMFHWVMAVDRRMTGWLNLLFHARWREALLHTMVRFDLLCPVYCLMPDHAHMIWVGCRRRADQRRAVAFFRRETNAWLAPNKWQREPYDHVLRENERAQGAFQAACTYVLENPVRKNLSGRWDEYEFAGAMVPGMPDLEPRREDFWEVFWKIYNQGVTEGEAAP